ncbi:MAG: hypothetical protein HYW48_08005 [Deltaproteobacteria bacterium]|nr:hypothetical protein [Deltaproteobacteria bacterium]
MEEPAAQFPPNHLLATRGTSCAVSSKPPPCHKRVAYYTYCFVISFSSRR